MINALAPWFGSNRMLAEHVGQRFHGFNWVGVPFGGGLAELKYIKARTIVVSDKHRHIINMARVVADKEMYKVLVEGLSNCLFHPDVLGAAQALCEQYGPGQPHVFDAPPDIEWANAYFICCWMARSSQAGTEKEFETGLALRYTAKGGDSVVRFRNAVASLLEWHQITNRCSFSTTDVFEFLAKCHDDLTHGIYCDPPFFDVGDAYAYKFTYSQHCILAKHLRNFKKTRVVCRFYDHPKVRKLYGDDHWDWTMLEGRKQSNASGPEVLLMNRTGND